MDQVKLMNSMLDTAIATANELLINNIQAKAEIRVYNDMINELREYVKKLEYEVSVKTTDEHALNTKAAHLDNALKQLAETQSALNDSENHRFSLIEINSKLEKELEKYKTVEETVVAKKAPVAKTEAKSSTKTRTTDDF